MKVASRTRVLPEGEHFFDVFNFLDNIDESFFNTIHYFSENLEKEIRLICEYYGPGIQKGIFYGHKRGIVIFDVMIDGMLLSPVDAKGLLLSLGLGDYFVPDFGIVSSLEEALNFNVEGVDSLLIDEKDNQIEGIVIKPYSSVYSSPQGSIFYIKKKAEKFKEKASEKRVIIEQEDHPLKSVFKQYAISENRMNNVFSKHGPIESLSDIGKYIKLIIEDSIEDFIVEVGKDKIDTLNKKDRKNIFNVGNLIARMLKEYLLREEV